MKTQSTQPYASTSRTPLPWIADSNKVVDTNNLVIADLETSGSFLNQEESNADFIVLACNNFERVCRDRDALLAALKAAVARYEKTLSACPFREETRLELDAAKAAIATAERGQL